MGSTEGVEHRTCCALTPGSAFGHFPRRKPAGAVRIGCFGDSFTWGDEVADGNDYPALLAALFSRAGAPHVEVLNFGNTAFGFNQTYVMREDVGRRYELLERPPRTIECTSATSSQRRSTAHSDRDVEERSTRLTAAAHSPNSSSST